LSLPSAIEKDVSVLKKIAAFSIALVGAMICIQIILLPFIIVLNTSLVSNGPKMISALIFVVGLGLAIVGGIILFKKMFAYFTKVLQKI